MFKKGDKVRVKDSVRSPYYAWGKVTRGSVGVVVRDAAENADFMAVDFPEQRNWSAKPREMELVETSLATPVEAPVTAQGSAVSALTTRVASTSQGVQTPRKRKSPEKVLAYGVILKDGSLHSVKYDRDDARSIKAELGGKQKGVTIVVLTAGKEIR